MSHDKKISLIGAGNIGTILAFSLSRKKLGNITLIDKVKGLAEGKCLDLSQSLSAENLNTKIIGTNNHPFINSCNFFERPNHSVKGISNTNYKGIWRIFFNCIS